MVSSVPAWDSHGMKYIADLTSSGRWLTHPPLSCFFWFPRSFSLCSISISFISPHAVCKFRCHRGFLEQRARDANGTHMLEGSASFHKSDTDSLRILRRGRASSCTASFDSLVLQLLFCNFVFRQDILITTLHNKPLTSSHICGAELSWQQRRHGQLVTRVSRPSFSLFHRTSTGNLIVKNISLVTNYCDLLT